MRVFVTGGTGHTGSYIIPELIAAGHEVTGLCGEDRDGLVGDVRRVQHGNGSGISSL
jgi:nucleoside-diphosphate-sugar epimerase